LYAASRRSDAVRRSGTDGDAHDPARLARARAYRLDRAVERRDDRVQRRLGARRRSLRLSLMADDGASLLVQACAVTVSAAETSAFGERVARSSGARLPIGIGCELHTSGCRMLRV